MGSSRGVTAKGGKISFWGDDGVLKSTVGDGRTAL